MQQWKSAMMDDEPRGLLAETGLDTVEHRMRQLSVGNSLDRLGVIVQEHLDTGGKRIRARLALAAGEALGLERERLVDWAAACELLHNATLIHDDVQDGDRVRRGRPTTWVRHGTAQAINAGDLMLMLPYLAVASADVEPAASAALMTAIAEHAAETVRGQALELELPVYMGHLRDAWTRAALGKTGALMGLPVRGAALVAGLPPAEASALGELFALLGVVFQLQDDVLDLYGDKGRDEVGCDLQEGKVSALVVAHLERAPEDGQWLRTVLAAERGMTSPEEVARIALRFRESGALAEVLAEICEVTACVLDDERLARHGLVDLARELVVLSCRPIATLLARELPAGTSPAPERRGWTGQHLMNAALVAGG